MTLMAASLMMWIMMPMVLYFLQAGIEWGPPCRWMLTYQSIVWTVFEGKIGVNIDEICK